MELPIQKWGSSAALCLPKDLLTQLRVAPGDKFSVEVRAGGLLLTPVRRSYSICELIAQCDADAPMPSDLADWNEADPVGYEKW